jgi:hypothetical protein
MSYWLAFKEKVMLDLCGVEGDTEDLEKSGCVNIAHCLDELSFCYVLEDRLARSLPIWFFKFTFRESLALNEKSSCPEQFKTLVH